MDIGVINTLSDGGRCFDMMKQLDLHVCQLSCWDGRMATKEIAQTVVKEASAANVRICAVWAGWPPPAEWNFTAGPVTLGIVPAQYRQERLKALKQWADFAVWIGAPAIITHCGFIPEDMTSPEYPPVVAAIKDIAEYCEERGIGFWFETGQETPVVLLRTIEKVGTNNMGINLDPANLIMYGKANPIDALDVFGRYVRNIHVKDGMYPTNGDQLGIEVPAGQGKVRYPEFIASLQRIGFDGDLIIEREISGEEQIRDIKKTMADLVAWQKLG